MANGASDLGPEPTVILLGELASRLADGLAGEPATDEVDTRNLLPVDLRHVAEVRHVGPVLREHAAAVRVHLGLPRHGHAGTLEAQVQAADAAEQRPDPHERIRLTITTHPAIANAAVPTPNASEGQKPITTTGRGVAMGAVTAAPLFCRTRHSLSGRRCGRGASRTTLGG